MNPKLRQISFEMVEHEGQQIWVLRDSLQLSEEQIALPYALARMVSNCDGSHSAESLHQLLCQDAGQYVDVDIVTDTLQQLDDLFLLENKRSAMAIDKIKQQHRAQPFRPPAFAGLNYPDDPKKLHDFLEAYSEGDTTLAEWQGWNGRAIIAPHIDYQRGGSVYAQTYQRAKEAIESAEIILVFGTDHNGGRASLTLTQLPYATPYGVLPTDTDIVNQLAAAIGEEPAYRLELNHRSEHSIELAAVWIHHMRQNNPCPVIPLLIGSFYHFTPNGNPMDDPTIKRFIDTLKDATKGKKVLSVASVDLAHVGPVFDCDYVMDEEKSAELAQSDAALRNAIAKGDVASFYSQIASTRNANNICGFSPVTLMLHYLNKTSGIDIAYDQCSADAQNESIVSICGMLLD